MSRLASGSKASRPVPCRLHFLLAREAPVGVLFRRGPSRWVRLIRWNVADDTFDLGQWFKGRIYEKRSDLSPDGTKVIYFAQKINRRTLTDPGFTYAWTAISRPPFLTALGLWPKGDCWNGGGLFETNARVLLNHADASPHESHPAKGLDVISAVVALGEDNSVLDRRLSRDGWRLVQPWQGRFIESPYALAHQEMMERGLSVEEMMKESFRRNLHELSTDSGHITDAPEIREKARPIGGDTLVMTLHLDKFARRYKFRLRETRLPALNGAEWADWDQRGRLAFARDGKLVVAEKAGERWTVRGLADFNAQKPEAMVAPAWATEW